ncbi:nuclear transport factor 2 family protein [Mesorhizobium sp. AD1-1]|uniref:nuclear transport factor 2 family protein n=1 Tax=Mesorhizobium sp. AD1-1 TaxID=2876621 RepID=UPI001CCFC8DA|nr:nuclear transport factor 2 family protein [Mesorhizobium sp. AD1-1]MBZ9720487.1 nuclear transport factor 2 family protein [Mesorhizobium sp. AD1-1]
MMSPEGLTPTTRPPGHGSPRIVFKVARATTIVAGFSTAERGAASSSGSSGRVSSLSPRLLASPLGQFQAACIMLTKSVTALLYMLAINTEQKERTMTGTNGKALAIAQAYFEAMANKDAGNIVSISAEDVACISPVGELQGVQAFRGFQEGFAKMIKKLTLLAAFGDDEHAVIVYDAETYSVPNAIVAEHIIVKHGKIASTTVIYDGTPFAEYMKTVQPH